MTIKEPQNWFRRFNEESYFNDIGCLEQERNEIANANPDVTPSLLSVTVPLGSKFNEEVLG
ncbi:MAG: hypothetical protein ACM3P0_09370 [Acidobacteriota bacterium]